jgi:hypothetical protein
MKLPEKTGCTVDELITIAEVRKRREAGEDAGDSNLRSEEYEALVRGREETTQDTDFATRAAELPGTLAPYLTQVQLVTRLREVRVLDGFSRIYPPHGGDGEQGNVVALRSEGVDWLPGIEVRGEGLFFRLDPDAVKVWEQRDPVNARAALIADRDRKLHEEWGTSQPRPITPRFLLAHVLAHAIINQLALDAGYPAASLRERLFVDTDECAMLIYTATSDSAGSLGGIISRGTGPLLEALIKSAVRGFEWCSADPVCIESEAGGVDALNLAACHCCALLPETSCEEMNSFLDRGLLVGIPDDPGVGYFQGLE